MRVELHHPGDLLAGRYLLDALLSEVDGGRFWFAWDQVLARNVAIHVIAGQDPRAARLLRAAGRAATVTDTRPLKILDAETLSDPDGDDLVMVVNEWGHGSSLDHLIVRTGPLPARHGAWVVAEVAAGIEAAHRAGLAHGRLNPENVLVDALGSIRIIGLAVEAVLHSPAEPTEDRIEDPKRDDVDQDAIDRDVTDLAGLLHFALTGRWAGASPSAVPAVPVHHGRLLRPRQVRAGVPRVLDDLVDGVLNPDDTGTGESVHWTAQAIASVLNQYVGDSTGIGTEIVANTGARVIVPQVALSPFPERYFSEHDRGSDAESATGGTSEVGPDLEPEAITSRVEEATEVGVPIFDEESDDVEWFSPRPTPPAPPPVLEDPPPKPLFATDSPGARRARTAGHQTDAFAPVPPPDVVDSGYWPWAPGTFGPGEYVDSEPVDSGRNWFWIIVAFGLAILLAIGAWALINLRDEDSGTGVANVEPTSQSSQVETGLPEQITGVSVRDFDPEDRTGEEFPELAPFAIDTKAGTAWQTSTYRQQLSPTGYKSGVGLVVDLGGEYSVSEVRLRMVGQPTTVSVYLTSTSPSSLDGLKPDRTVIVGVSGKATFDPVTGSFLTLWLTKLPKVDGGFRGAVEDVTVYGVFNRG